MKGQSKWHRTTCPICEEPVMEARGLGYGVRYNVSDNKAHQHPVGVSLPLVNDRRREGRRR